MREIPIDRVKRSKRNKQTKILDFLAKNGLKLAYEGWHINTLKHAKRGFSMRVFLESLVRRRN